MAERLWPYQLVRRTWGGSIFIQTSMFFDEVLVFGPVNVSSSEHIVSRTDNVKQSYAKSGCSDIDIVVQTVDANCRRSDDYQRRERRGDVTALTQRNMTADGRGK